MRQKKNGNIVTTELHTWQDVLKMLRWCDDLPQLSIAKHDDGVYHVSHPITPDEAGLYDSLDEEF